MSSNLTPSFRNPWVIHGCKAIVWVFFYSNWAVSTVFILEFMLYFHLIWQWDCNWTSLSENSVYIFARIYDFYSPDIKCRTPLMFCIIFVWCIFASELSEAGISCVVSRVFAQTALHMWLQPTLVWEYNVTPNHSLISETRCLWVGIKISGWLEQE